MSDDIVTITLPDSTQAELDQQAAAFLEDPLYQAMELVVDTQERAGTLCFCPNCRTSNNYEDAKWDYTYSLYEAVKARLFGPRVLAA